MAKKCIFKKGQTFIQWLFDDFPKCDRIDQICPYNKQEKICPYYMNKTQAINILKTYIQDTYERIKFD